LRNFFAYHTSFIGGVRVAAGDYNGDGRADILTGSGPSTVLFGQTAQLRWWDGRTALNYLDQDAYPGFLGGMFVG